MLSEYSVTLSVFSYTNFSTVCHSDYANTLHLMLRFRIISFWLRRIRRV